MMRLSVPFPRLFSLIVFLNMLGLHQTASAQNNTPQTPDQKGVTATEPSILAAPVNGSPEQKPANPAPIPRLLIGPGDDLDVTVYGAPDLSGHMRVSASGNISLPLIGYVRIAGLTSSEAEGA